MPLSEQRVNGSELKGKGLAWARKGEELWSQNISLHFFFQLWEGRKQNRVLY